MKGLQAPAAAGERQSLFGAQVPHPADWDDLASQPQVWQLEDDGWAALT